MHGELPAAYYLVVFLGVMGYCAWTMYRPARPHEHHDRHEHL